MKQHQNSVELIGVWGGDNSHALAAWSSTFLEFDVPMPEDINLRVDYLVDYILSNTKRKRAKDELLKYLASENHESPFRFSTLCFAMTTEIASHIQKLKHSVILEAENAESARYKELKEDKFYLPLDWQDKEISPKKLNHKLIEISGAKTWYELLEFYSNMTNEIYHLAYADLKGSLGTKRAKESARFFKMYNSQLNSTNKFSFAGVMEFYRKRHDKNKAQIEIAEIAERMVELVQKIPNNPFEYSLKAFGF